MKKLSNPPAPSLCLSIAEVAESDKSKYTPPPEGSSLSVPLPNIPAAFILEFPVASDCKKSPVTSPI